jgi:hypothetical protein
VSIWVLVLTLAMSAAVAGNATAENRAASTALVHEWTLHCERSPDVHAAFNLGNFSTGDACEAARTHLLEVDGHNVEASGQLAEPLFVMCGCVPSDVANSCVGQQGTR